MKILTTTIKKQLRYVVVCFFKKITYNIAIGLWSPLTKAVSKFIDFNEFCTHEGILKKNFEKYKTILNV